jgi:WD40 repeat protein
MMSRLALILLLALSLPCAAAPGGKTPASLRPRSADWSPDGATIALGADGVTLVLDAATRRELRRLGESRGDHTVSFLPDGRLAVIGASDNRSVLWDARGGKRLEIQQGAVACARSHATAWWCATARDGVRFTWSHSRLRAERWDGRDLRPLWTITDSAIWSSPTAVAARSADTVAFVGHGARSRTATERVVVHMPSADGRATGGFLERRPRWIAGGFVRTIWKQRLGCEVLGLGEKIQTLALARKNSGAVVGDGSGLVLYLNGCKIVHRLREHRAPIVAVAIAPTDWSVVSVDDTGLACWWNTYKGKRVRCERFAPR